MVGETSGSDGNVYVLDCEGGFTGVKVKMLAAQSCPTLCDPVACSPPGPSVHGILQTETLEWVASPSSRGSSPPRDRTQVSCMAGRLFTS